MKKRLQHVREAIAKEKLQMLWWIKCGQVTQQQEIGKRLGRDTSTVTRWLQKYRRGGLEELLQIKKAPENARKINGEVLADLQQQLQNPGGFSAEFAKQHGGKTQKQMAQLWDKPISDQTIARALEKVIEAISPSINLRTIPNTHINAPMLLEQAEIDIAIGVFPSPPSRLRSQPLLTSSWVCAMRRNHPLAKKS